MSDNPLEAPGAVYAAMVDDFYHIADEIKRKRSAKSHKVTSAHRADKANAPLDAAISGK